MNDLAIIAGRWARAQFCSERAKVRSSQRAGRPSCCAEALEMAKPNPTISACRVRRPNSLACETSDFPVSTANIETVCLGEAVATSSCVSARFAAFTWSCANGFPDWWIANPKTTERPPHSAQMAQNRSTNGAGRGHLRMRSLVALKLTRNSGHWTVIVSSTFKGPGFFVW